jgi:hypothetical protein
VVCPICGAVGGACCIIPAQHPVLSPARYQQSGVLARYQDAQGHVFTMTAADAAKAGYTLAGAEE